MAKVNVRGGSYERNKVETSVIDDSLGCPRMVTRLWGIVVAIGMYGLEYIFCT